MNIDDELGERLYKVAATKPHRGGYFTIISKLTPENKIIIEFGSKNIDGSLGTKWQSDEIFTKEEADIEIARLIKSLNAKPLRFLQREKWYLHDLTPWGNLAVQMERIKTLDCFILVERPI